MKKSSKSSQASKPTKPEKPLIPEGARQLAISQARAFAANASTLAGQLKIPADAGAVLTYLVNAGLAIELYLKTFLISIQAGKVDEVHNLSVLLGKFPNHIKDSFNTIYDDDPIAKIAQVRLLSLRLSDSTSLPAPNYEHKDRYNTFEQAVASVARVFVDARYFFERINGKDWVVVAYPTEAIAAILRALETTFQKYESGELTKGK